MDLEKLNSQLPRDRPFRITSAEVISGLFGESIVLHLEDGQAVYLPNRVTEVYKKNLGFFSSKKYAVIYEGEVDCGYTEPLQSFKDDTTIGAPLHQKHMQAGLLY
ncbi:unnamed protein product [Callosobruchus maculatus]|uniref:Uncharacterized protein n=1 Tax=Callosobruchus maculatus TaxID=64391 RepID=A0A653CMN3_CALMS|nr:unnamed protein product [Callosobruchus maculatus]